MISPNEMVNNCHEILYEIDVANHGVPFGLIVAYRTGLGFDRSKLVLTGTGGLNRLKPVKTGQNCTKLINWPQRLTK